MKKFAIVSDSSCDLNKEFREAHHIDYAKMMLTWDDNGITEIPASLDWEIVSSKQFHDVLRRGIRIYTALVTKEEFLSVFEPHMEKGEDVLYIACSSGLSATLNTARLLADNELKEKYPNQRLVVLDSMRAGMALGMIIMRAVELQEAGKSMDEVIEIIEQEKLQYKEVGIPDSLSYLRRAGRVSAGPAFFGNMISLKPILVFDKKGSNVAVKKAVGRKAAFKEMANMIKEDIVDPENQDIYLMEADCEQVSIDMFSKAVRDVVSVRNIIVQPLGPIIGASSGPGTIIINYKGK